MLTLGSPYSLLWAVSLAKNDYQSFSLSFQIRTGCKQPIQSEGDASRTKKAPSWVLFVLEASPGFEPGNNGFADRGLTTWL